MNGYDFNRLREFADNPENCVQIGQKETEQFEMLCSMLIETNKTHNLTSIVDPKEVETKHFIDSLMAASDIKKRCASDEFSLIDVGCGAGFPGLPLKIVFPEAEFVMIDSVGKKIDFVNAAAKELGLQNIIAMAERAEVLARTEYREKFDFCTARAVANLPVLIEYCLPFVKVGGYAILFKSGEYQEELVLAQNAIKTIGGGEPEVREFNLPYTLVKRSLIIIKKEMPTPEKYPRRTGKAAKSPLL